jgi:hypothetical protein
VHFSCKITHAILTQLESEKIDLSAYFSDADIPWEKLRDSSLWMRAPDMEAFLDRIVTSQQTLIDAGHATPKSKVWGVLDSVLRMMPQPQEIFHQPEKFLGYFISPEPPIENIVRTAEGIAFDIPLPAEQYPLVTTYLKAAFEALPFYVGMDAGVCRWNFLRFELDWPKQQQSILKDEPHQISPQLMQDVISQLQQSSRDLEERNRELQRRNEELMSRSASAIDTDMKSVDFNQFENQQDIEFDFMNNPVHQVAQNLSRLQDYMVRAQQLVMLLTAGQKQSPGIKQAFHKTDWEIVKVQFPKIIVESLEILKKVNK